MNGIFFFAQSHGNSPSIVIPTEVAPDLPNQLLERGVLLTHLSNCGIFISITCGAWPSGKAVGFGPAIRRFESFRPRSPLFILL